MEKQSLSPPRIDCGLHHHNGQLCDPRILWRFPNPDFGGIRLVERGILSGHRAPEPCMGIGQPIFGAMAENVGDRKAIILGAVIYALGLILSAGADTPIAHQTCAWLVGFGIAGAGFGVILALVGRAASNDNRSMALAVVTAADSAGQIFGARWRNGCWA